MLKNPTRTYFVDSLNFINNIEIESADQTKAVLVGSVKPFVGEELDSYHVGDVLIDLIQQSLEFIVNSKLEK